MAESYRCHIVDVGLRPLRSGSPPPYPLLGHVPAYLRDRLAFFAACTDARTAVRCRLGWEGYVLNDPEDVRHVLQGNAANYAKARRLAGHRARWSGGHGLLTSAGAEHRRKRLMLQPLFREPLAERVRAVAAANAERTLAGWGGEVDVAAELMALAQRNILVTLLDDASEELLATLAAASAARRRFVQAVYFSLFPFPEYRPTPTNLAYARAMRRVDPAIYATIAARRRSKRRPDDLLTMLLEATDGEGRGLSDRELRDEILTFALTGHETVGEALAWTLYLLGDHSDVADSLAADWDAALALRVVRESMRLYPPTWIYARVAREADALPSGTRVGAGAMVYVSQHVLHRSPYLWDEPARFDPDRFLADAVRARPRFAYLPFGSGPHVCIGESLALAEILTVLERVLTGFRLEVRPGSRVEPDAGLTLRPRGGLPMRLERR